MELKDLEIYRLSVEIADECWQIYNLMSWSDKKMIGDQWIRAVDSVAANIAEGFGRFHYLDKNKFNYNARGSLFESIHWIDTLKKRNKITEGQNISLTGKLKNLSIKLNNYISKTKDIKNGM
jgi:four helix bundle protein